MLPLRGAANVRQQAPVEVEIQTADILEVKSVKAELVQVTNWNADVHEGSALLDKSGSSKWMEHL